MIFKALLLLVGVFACSTAAIMIKSCQVNPVLLAAYRMLVAALLLFPFYLRDMGKHRGNYSLKHILRCVPPGILMGLHFMVWIAGTRLTDAASATLIVNMTPVITPLLLYFIARERVHTGEYVGTAIAICGVILLCAGGFGPVKSNLSGNLLSFASMIFLAIYLVLGRRNRDFASLLMYVVPLYFVGGIFCFIVAICQQVNPLDLDGTRGISMIIGLAIVPTVIGHSIFNYLMKHIRGQIVAVGGLGQFIFGGIMGYLILDEIPNLYFYPACLLVVVGSVITLRSSGRQWSALESVEE